MTASRLLAALLERHWRGGVSQEQAARLLGIRKQDFADLSAYRKVQAMEPYLLPAARRYYRIQFAYLFPETDPMAIRRDPVPSRGNGIRQFTDEELLTPPQHRTMDELLRQSSDCRTAALAECYHGDIRSAPEGPCKALVGYASAMRPHCIRTLESGTALKSA